MVPKVFLLKMFQCCVLAGDTGLKNIDPIKRAINVVCRIDTNVATTLKRGERERETYRCCIANKMPVNVSF